MQILFCLFVMFYIIKHSWLKIQNNGQRKLNQLSLDKKTSMLLIIYKVNLISIHQLQQMGCCQTGPLSNRRYRFRTTNMRNIIEAKEADKQPSGKQHTRIIVRLKDISTPQQLLFEIKKIIINNRDQYGLLSEEVFNQIFQNYDTIYYPQDELYSLINYLLQYMIECYNRSLPKMQQKIQAHFFAYFGKRIKKVQNEALEKNRNILRIMSYLEQNLRDYGCYLDLKFDLNIEQAMTVADKVRDLFEYDERSFFFLTNYLYASCSNLQKQEYDLRQIEQILKHFIDQIIQKYPVLPQLIDSGEAKYIQNYKMQEHLIRYNQILLLKFQEDQKKEMFISFIMDQAKQAQKHYTQFIRLIKDVCLEKGNNFKIGLKIKNQHDNRAIQRVIEKIIDQNSGFIIFEVRDYMGRKNKKTLQGFINQEERQYERELIEIYSKYTDPIFFKVEDMLRAKCQFKTISDINECADKIQQKIDQNKQIKLVEISNRLRAGDQRISDVVLRIMIGKTLTQLRLCLKRNSSRNQFVNKVFTITNSKFLSPLSMLKNLNQDLKRDILEDSNKCFSINNNSTIQRQRQIYQMPKTFKILQLKFQYLMKVTNFQPIQFKVNQSQVLTLIKQELNFLIQEHQIFKLNYSETKKMLKNNGDYFLNTNKHDKSFQQYQSYLKRLQDSNSKQKQNIEEIAQTSTKMGKQQQQLGQYKEALNCYEKSVTKIQAISLDPTLKLSQAFINVGLMHWSLGNSYKALNNYHKYLDIQYKLKGQQNYSQLQIFTKVIELYDNQKVYDKALLYYSHCFQLQQKFKEIEELDIQWAPIFYKLGLIYFNQGNYEETIKYYEKCIKIQEEAKDKKAVIPAQVIGSSLALTYWKQKKYKISLSYYEKCLEIKRKKGRQQLDEVQTLYNMAMIQSQQGSDKQSLQILLKCLSIQEQTMGIGAYCSAQILHSIGLVYDKLGNHKKALDYYIKSLQIKERADGQLSIDGVVTLQKIGDMLKQQKKYKQSLRYFEQCLVIQQRVNGKQSIYSIPFLNKISLVHIEERNFEMALDRYFKCLQINEKSYGKESIEVAQTLNNIAYVHDIQDNFNQALQFYGKSKDMYQNTEKGKGQNKKYLKILRDMDNIYSRKEKLK